MQTILLKSILPDSGNIYRVRDGNRECEIVDNIAIKLYEQRREINTLGSKGLVINNRVSIVLTNPLNEIPKSGDGYSLEVDLKRNDGIYERVYIHNLIPVNIDLSGEWEFEMDPSCLEWSRFL